MSSLKGAEIAQTVSDYAWFLWEKILGTNGPQRKYYDNEWSCESDLYTSVFRLSLIGAARHFDLGAINEHSKIDVVWVSSLPKPIEKFGVNTRHVDPKDLRLLAESEMMNREVKALDRLSKFDRTVSERGSPELWNVLITWRQLDAFRHRIPTRITNSGAKWLIITEAPPKSGAWLQYHEGANAFDSPPCPVPRHQNNVPT